MNLSHFDKHLKTSAFEKFKLLLYKYYPGSSKISKSSVHVNQFLVLLYDCLPSSKHFF